MNHDKINRVQPRIQKGTEVLKGLLQELRDQCNFLIEQERYCDQIIARDGEQKDLRKARRMQLQGDYRRLVVRLLQAYRDYDRLICILWCEGYHERLPCEIRDMIYLYLIPLQTIQQFISVIQQGNRGTRNYNEGFVLANSTEPCFRIANVGFNIFHEIMTVVYNRTLWQIRLDRIDRFFKPRSLVSIPVRDVVQRLTVVLSCAQTRERRATLLRFLKPLETVKVKTAVKLFLELDKANPREVLEVLHDISPWIFRMKNSGFQLEVTSNVYNWPLDFMKLIGNDLLEFEEWSLTWPENVSCALT